MKQKSKLKRTEIGKMPEDWEVVKLSSHIEIIGGGTPRTTIDEYWGGKIPWISVADFTGDKRWIHETEKTITEKGLEKSSTKILHKGQLIISARGTVGEVAQIERDMAFNQSCYGLDGKNSFDNDYLYYLLKFKINGLKRMGHGAVFNTITRETFDHLLVPMPSLYEQKAIAKVLSDLDSKIELDNKLAENLEFVGQTLFKKWFIDLEEIPSDWETKSLDEIADFLNGLALQKYPVREGEEFLPVIKIRELRNGVTEQTDKSNTDLPKEYVVNEGDVLFSWSGSLEVVLWAEGKGALNQHLFKVTSDKYPKWFYYFWIKHHLPEFQHIAKSKATTMGHIQKHHLTEAEVLVPGRGDLEKMDKVMGVLLEKIISLKLELQKLSKIRELLLPKLMSGEIRIRA